MHTFVDGPAAGVNLCCSRAPLFLRVVCGPGMDGQWDALDQIADIPESDEVVHCYRMKSHDGTVHYDGRDKNGKRFGRWEEMATYALSKVQPDEATMRNNIAWRKWCQAQKEAEDKEKADAAGT